MSEQTAGKGKPTPKRSEAQKRKAAVVTPPPTNRREAARQLRAKQAENRKRVREGTARGDEATMLRRDQGPVRKLVRDLIDARRSLGWILLPIALLVVITGILRNPALQAFTFSIWLASLAGVAIDMVFTGFMLRRQIRRAFPEERKLRGHIAYGLLRTTVMRRFRMPKPQVHP